MKFIRRSTATTSVSRVAGYPEGHPDTIVHVGDDESKLSASERTGCRITEEDGQRKVYVCPDAAFKLEMDYLKKKVDAGADAIITQMFFDANTYGAFLKACRKHGINVPVIPGIMLVQAAGGFRKMTAMCKTRVPAAVKESVDAKADNDVALKAYGVDLGVEISHQLLAVGAPGLHFYTLNLDKTNFRYCQEGGGRPRVVQNGSGLAQGSGARGRRGCVGCAAAAQVRGRGWSPRRHAAPRRPAGSLVGSRPKDGGVGDDIPEDGAAPRPSVWRLDRPTVPIGSTLVVRSIGGVPAAGGAAGASSRSS